MSGYTLTLNYDNGEQQKLGLYIWGDPAKPVDDHPALGINGKNFYVRSDVH